MTLKQWFFNLVGANKRAKRSPDVDVNPPQAPIPIRTAQEQHERDALLAKESWKRLGLNFRSDGYEPADWIAPIVVDSTRPQILPQGDSLIHLNVHPLACYRALGLSRVVDHWVPWVAEDGWTILTQDLPYILKRLGPARQWGHIEHPAFWKEVASMLATKDTTGVHTQGLLQHAGWAGNLVPFDTLPVEHIEQYSKSGQTCHPRVALWLHTAGLLPREELLASLGNWDHLFPLGGYTFLQWNKATPTPVAYILDWLQPLLADFPLTLEHKAALVGQAILAFGIDTWDKYFAPTCQPHLDGMDMTLLRAVCGVWTPQTDPLLETIYARTKGFKPPLHADFENIWFDHREQLKNPHAGLCLLMDLQEPSSRVQLYSLAVLAQKIDKGLIAAPDTLALPSLD